VMQTPKPLPQIEVQGASANMGKRAVITTTGNNDQGIAARVTSVISEAGGDIVDISQTLVGDYFTMILVVDLSKMAASGMTFHAFRQKLEEASALIGISITVMHEDILNAMHRI
jgi:ACT domain-containing protein